MSRQMNIKKGKGPSGKHLLFASKLIAEYPATVVFIMDQKIPDGMCSAGGGGYYEFQPDMIGQITKNKNEFIIFCQKEATTSVVVDGHLVSNILTYYYVIHYNIQNRTGYCTEYTEKEFFDSQVMRFMFKFPEPTSPPSLEDRFRENGVLEAKPTK